MSSGHWVQPDDETESSQLYARTSLEARSVLPEAPTGAGHWRVHDRTHLEFVVTYEIDPHARRQSYTWEAYFMVPRSLRVDSANYSKEDIYRDFQSYVRFGVRELPLQELGEFPESSLSNVLGQPERANYALRLFGCMVRSAAHRGRERLLQNVELIRETDVRSYVDGLSQVAAAYRRVIAKAETPEVKAAASWVDEDISFVIEGALASLCVQLKNRGHESASPYAASAATSEADYRRDTNGPQSVRPPPKVRPGQPRLSRGLSVDELELHRHALKRFTSSVLWIHKEVSQGAKWIRQALYAVAASIAMAFAITTARYYGGPNPLDNDKIWLWVVLAVLAYAGKDRIKAALQTMFSDWAGRRYPDRRWTLGVDGARGPIATVDERSRFVGHSSLPGAARLRRDASLENAIELQARTERVLWHQKNVELRSTEIAALESRFSSVTEILRLDLSRWLLHTDDPKQRVYLADPDRAEVFSTVARRLYHVDVLYRISGPGEATGDWLQARVVFNRNGVKRVYQLA